jgi:hypothetical protein
MPMRHGESHRTVMGNEHPETVLLQVTLDEPRNVAVVLDNEDELPFTLQSAAWYFYRYARPRPSKRFWPRPNQATIDNELDLPEETHDPR